MTSNTNIATATAIGTLIEWAEFTLYGYLAYKFAHLFFPPETKDAILLSFGLFAASYLARPFGAIIFGWLGDVIGRKIALSLSLILMGIATLGIGLMPTYATIGIWAPVLLLLCRVIQGISVSGEFTGAAIFIAEHYQGEYKNLSISWVSFSSAFGMLIGAAMATLISLDGMPGWAWRIPFFIGFFGCLIGFYFRFNLPETKAFTAQKESNQSYDRYPLQHSKGQLLSLLQCFLIASFVGIYIYICNLWWVAFAIQKGYFSNANAHMISTLGILCVVIMTPIFAYFTDKYSNAKTMLRWGLFLAIFITPSIFLLTSTGNILLGLFAQLIYAIGNILVTAVMFRFLCTRFPVNTRYSSLGISWSFAVAIIGGTAPLIAQYFTFNLNKVTYIISCVCTIAFLAWLSLSFKKNAN